MTDDRDQMPTQRLGPRRRIEATTPVTATVIGNQIELHINGQSVRVSKEDGRRLLAALLETLG